MRVRRVCEQVVIVKVWELEKLQSQRRQIKNLTNQDLTTIGRQTPY